MSWGADEVEDLIELRSGESQTLEFKSELPAFSDRGKAEFLKDVCAMANASGGSILYGIAEIDGYADRLSIDQIDGHDSTLRRLAQIVEAGIEPRIKIRSSVISVADNEVLAVEIPASLSGPHRFKFNDKYRFVVRHERHISDLTYEQLRSAFGNQVDRRRTAENWWAQINPANYFARPIMTGPSIASALVPVSHDGVSTLLDPLSVEKEWTALLLRRFRGGSPSFNYYGLSAFPGGRSEEVRAFSQAERTGPIYTWRALESFHIEDPEAFYGAWFIEFVRDSFQMQKKVFEMQGLSGSFFFFAGLKGIGRKSMITVDIHGFSERHEGSITKWILVQFSLKICLISLTHPRNYLARSVIGCGRRSVSPTALVN